MILVVLSHFLTVLVLTFAAVRMIELSVVERMGPVSALLVAGLATPGAWMAVEAMQRLKGIRLLTRGALIAKVFVGVVTGTLTLVITAAILPILPGPWEDDMAVLIAASVLSTLGVFVVLPRHIRGCCRACGYDLRGVLGRSQCPECGAERSA